jgi:hypothetical protein
MYNQPFDYKLDSKPINKLCVVSILSHLPSVNEHTKWPIRTLNIHMLLF